MDPADVDLLAIEIDTNWTRDERGRLVQSRRSDLTEAAPHVVIAKAAAARVVAFGSAVPDGVAAQLSAVIDADAPSGDPAEAPASLARTASIVSEAAGQVEVRSGPSYAVVSAPAFSSDADVVTSLGPPQLQLQVPDGFPWEPDEWRSLMGGALGPWAMCTRAGTPVSLCHSARLTSFGAEAGTWTHPQHRGRGYAAHATAAWASLFAPNAQRLFYSTSADNRSSQCVAERLGLRPIGWLWKLVAPISS